MIRRFIRLAALLLMAGCMAQAAPDQPAANAHYCESLSLLLDSVDPRMAAQAQHDMAVAHCAPVQ